MVPHRSLKREVVDPLVRSMEVAVRMDVFPKGKKEEVQLTNDFHVYCDLAVEAFGSGYSHYEKLFQEAPETIATLNGLLENYPHITDNAKAFMHDYAAKELGL